MKDFFGVIGRILHVLLNLKLAESFAMDTCREMGNQEYVRNGDIATNQGMNIP